MPSMSCRVHHVQYVTCPGAACVHSLRSSLESVVLMCLAKHGVSPGRQPAVQSGVCDVRHDTCEPPENIGGAPPLGVLGPVGPPPDSIICSSVHMCLRLRVSDRMHELQEVE